MMIQVIVHGGSPEEEVNLRWEGFVKRVSFKVSQDSGIEKLQIYNRTEM